MDRSTGVIRRVAVVAIVGAAFAAIAAPSAASAAEQSEVQRGAALLGALHNGQRECADLSSAAFRAIGEFAMQRMVGSAQAHEAMDRAMTRAMGPSGLEAMHRYLGERFSGCARGPAPRGIAGVAGMLGMMGGWGPGYGPGTMGRGYAPGGYPHGGSGGAYGPGMMGRGFAPGHGYGPGMMGFFNRSRDRDDGWTSADTFGAISLGVVLLLLIVATVAYLRRRELGPRRSASGAVGILDRRLAAGEIDRDEYQRRRAALSSGP